MHPELLNNSIFLKYYKRWQEDPTSILFAPVAEYFMRYDMPEDAVRILNEGLRHHPRLVSAHLVYAKVMIKMGDFEKARAALEIIFSLVPGSNQARELLNALEEKMPNASKDAKTSDVSLDFAAEMPLEPSEEMADTTEAFDEGKTSRIPSWETVTMANIYSAQGHFDKAREIYESILSREPANEAAARGLRLISENKAEKQPRADLIA